MNEWLTDWLTGSANEWVVNSNKDRFNYIHTPHHTTLRRHVVCVAFSLLIHSTLLRQFLIKWMLNWVDGLLHEHYKRNQQKPIKILFVNNAPASQRTLDTPRSYLKKKKKKIYTLRQLTQTKPRKTPWLCWWMDSVKLEPNVPSDLLVVVGVWLVVGTLHLGWLVELESFNSLLLRSNTFSKLWNLGFDGSKIYSKKKISSLCQLTRPSLLWRVPSLFVRVVLYLTGQYFYFHLLKLYVRIWVLSSQDWWWKSGGLPQLQRYDMEKYE